MEEAKTFAFYDHINNAIIVDEKLSEKDLGYYKLNMVAEETMKNETFKYKKELYLIVYERESAPGPKPEVKPEGPKRSGYLNKADLVREPLSDNKPLPRVRELDVTGKLTIDWSRVMVQPQNLNTIKDTKILVTGQTAQSTRDLEDLVEEAVNRLVTVDKSQEELDKLISLILELESIDVVVLDEFGDERKDVELDYTILNYAERELKLQLIFDDVGDLGV